VPSEEDTYADILAVYDHLVTIGVSPKVELIVYGQSVGTGPSCHLAAHRPIAGLVLHSPMVTGIRVISNQDGVCAPASVFRSCDLFPNVRHIPKIAALVRKPLLVAHPVRSVRSFLSVKHRERAFCLLPAGPSPFVHPAPRTPTLPLHTQTLIMHGTKDEVIDVAHAEHLLSKWPAAIKHEPYIVPGAGHDDVFETDPEEFYRRLLEFIHAATNNQSFTTTPPKAMTSPPIHPAKASDKLTRAF
jgi:alpha-beta hydrolase superfamily lysophospholipase